MEDTLRFIVSHIVDHPSDIEIKKYEENERTILEISAHTDDYGKIIGKNGHIIKAIRDLMKIIAVKNNIYLDVTLKENN